MTEDFVTSPSCVPATLSHLLSDGSFPVPPMSSQLLAYAHTLPPLGLYAYPVLSWLPRSPGFPHCQGLGELLVFPMVLLFVTVVIFILKNLYRYLRTVRLGPAS